MPQWRITTGGGKAVKHFEAELREPSGRDEPEGSRPTATIARFHEQKISHGVSEEGEKDFGCPVEN